MPLLSHTRKFAFVHVPKTGGTSILTALTAHVRNEGHFRTTGAHTTAAEVRHQVGAPRWDRQYFTCGIVRNPWEMLVSMFAAFSIAGSFEQFINGNVFPLFPGTQRDYLFENGRQIVSYIGRFERLDESYATIANHLGIDPTLPHENRSTHCPYREYYDDRTRDFVARRFAADVEEFDYEF